MARGKLAPEAREALAAKLRARKEAWERDGRPTRYWQEYKLPDEPEHVRHDRPLEPNPTVAAETPPKRPALKPGVKAAVPAAAARQIKSEFSLVLWGADNAAAKFAAQYWQTPEDRLSDDERTQLVTAIYGELEARFPRALQVLARVGESAPEAMLLYTVAMIAAPRLARHGVIPNDLATAIVFAPLVLANLQQQNGAAADVGAEPAPQPDRPNGDWQEHVSVPPLEIPTVQAGAPVEAGHGQVRHGPGSPNGTSDTRLPL